MATLEAFKGKALCTEAGVGVDEAYAPRCFVANGACVGFLSFSECDFGAVREKNEAGFAWVNHTCVDGLISDTCSRCEVLVIQVHAGVEEEDVPLPKWRDSYRRLLELGIDAVTCHHPHQPQGWERIDGKLIVYIFGNFYFHPAYPSPWRKTLSLSSEPEDFEHLDRLCCALEELEYSVLVDMITERLWEERYSKYYLNAVNGVDRRSDQH